MNIDVKKFNKLLACALLGLTHQANAQETVSVEQAFAKCKATYATEADAQKRLTCYDSIEAAEVKTEVKVAPQTSNKVEEAKINLAVEKSNPELSYIEKKWRLNSEGDWNITDFETHRSNYLLVQTTDNVNNNPNSPDFPDTNNRGLQPKDLQFQFSLKTELMKNIPFVKDFPFVTSSRLWAAYTQQSYWQIFNSQNSRPLRENDYQPELILSLGIDNMVDDRKINYIPRLLNLGFVHESNGLSDPLSRSWNRVYLEGGWEVTDRLSLSVRPWYRIPESTHSDDNPDIEKYLGYGDANLRWENESQKTAVSLLLRNNLRSDNKGYGKLDVSRKLYDDSKIKLHFSFSTGYGDSLLDYNHSQSTIGVGLSLGD